MPEKNGMKLLRRDGEKSNCMCACGEGKGTK